MARKIWIAIVLATTAVILMGALAYGGYRYKHAQDLKKWRAQGEMWYAKGDWAMASNKFGLYLREVPEDGDALIKYADAKEKVPFKKQLSYSFAADAYHRYIRLHPTDNTIKKRLLELYKKAGAREELAQYAESFQKVPLDSPAVTADDVDFAYFRAYALNLKALVSRAPNDLDAAADLYDVLKRRDDARPEAFANLATLRYLQGKLSDSETVIAEGRAKLQNSPAILLEVARHYRATGSLQKAEEILNKALASDPNKVDLLIERARVVSLQKRFGEALESAKRAVALVPDNAEAISTLVRIYAMIDDRDSAINAYATLTPEMRINDPDTLFLYTDLLYSEHRIEEARAAAEQYMSAYPSDQTRQEYFQGREILLSRDSKRMDEAVRIFERLADVNPNWSEVQYYLVQAYDWAGKDDSARIALDLYLRRNPTDELARTLYQQSTSAEPSPAEVRTKARAMLTSQDVSAIQLISAARSILANWSNATKEADTPLIRDLLQRAVDLDKGFIDGYRFLADFQVRTGDLDGASATIEKAVAAGISKCHMFIPTGQLALARQQVESLRSSIDEALASSDVTASMILEWANFLRFHGRADLADYAFQKAFETKEQQFQTGLTVSQIQYLAAWDSPESAVSAIEKAEASLEKGDTVGAKSLRGARLEVARRLVSTEEVEDNTEARKIVDEVLKTTPDDLTAKAILGILERNSIRLREVAESGSSDLVVFYGLSRLELDNNELSRALAFANRAAKLAPYSVDINLHFASVLAKTGRLSDAEAKLEALYTAAPTNFDVLTLYTDILIQAKKLPKAEVLLAKLKSRNDLSRDSQSKVAAIEAQLLLAKDQVGDAEKMIRDRLAEKPDDLQLLTSLADVLDRKGEKKQASEVYLDYLKRFPKDAEGLVALANHYLKQESVEGVEAASRALTDATVIGSVQPGIVKRMIEVQERLGNSTEALKWCDKYLTEIDKNDSSVLFKQAMLYANKGEWDEALGAVSKAYQADPRFEYRELRGLIYSELKDYENVLKDLIVLYRSPDDAPATVTLAIADAYASTRKREDARLYYDVALRKSTSGDSRISQERLRLVGEKLRRLEGTT